jgi:hypothetical protein
VANHLASRVPVCGRLSTTCKHKPTQPSFTGKTTGTSPNARKSASSARAKRLRKQ